MMEKKDTVISIRLVNGDDASQVCAICCDDLGYQCDRALVKERISQLDDVREAVFVAVIDENVVGYIHVEKYNTLYFETMANILGLAVSGKYRRHGVGKVLVDKAERWALDNDISLMRLNSGSSRSGAHKFYRRLGYGSEKDQIRFIKRLDVEE